MLRRGPKLFKVSALVVWGVLILYCSVGKLVKRKVKSVVVRHSALKEQYKVGIIFTSVPSCYRNVRSFFIEATGTKWGGRR